MQQDSTRRSAEEILEQVIENGRDELSRSTIGLMFSGFAGGLSMGLTGLAVALALSYLGKGPLQEFFSFFFIPSDSLLW
jgi:formate-nitrite transporter family protein